MLYNAHLKTLIKSKGIMHKKDEYTMICNMFIFGEQHF